MSRAYLIAILATAFVVAFALAPTSTASRVLSGFSNVAHAVDPYANPTNNSRMGGGPGKKAATAKTGKGTPTGGTTNKAINLNSSRSN